MNVSLLIVDFLPLILYIIVDAWKGFRAGIIAAIVSTLLMLVYDYMVFSELDKFVLGEGLMIVIMGLISLKMENDRYFKFQPAVLALVFALIFSWFQIFDQPVLVQALPHIEKLLISDDRAGEASEKLISSQDQPAKSDILTIMHSQSYRKMLRLMSFQMIWLFLAHGLIMGFAALRCSTRAWFAWRLAIYPALFFLIVMNQLLA
jgi:intracellular septation protein A